MRDARAIYGAPPPPRHEPCIACGKPTYNKRVCLPCEVVAGSMEALGLAIQRFVRIAEVNDLVARVEAYMYEPESYQTAEMRSDADDALERLATLAKHHN